MYTICIQYVYNMYTICIQYVYNMYTICIQYVSIVQNLWNIVEHIKFHISLLLTITTFLISPLLSLKAGCFSAIFSVCQTMYVPGTS